MTLFFHPFLMIPKSADESVRLARLDWWVLSDEWRIIRGYQFHIDPVASGWEMTEDGAVCESGDTFDRPAVVGHPVENVLRKFIDDHDVCQTAIAVDADAAFAILIYEAKKAGIAATKRITDRRSLKDYTDQRFDMKGGLKPFVEFFIKPGGHGFPEFNPVTTL